MADFRGELNSYQWLTVFFLLPQASKCTFSAYSQSWSVPGVPPATLVNTPSNTWKAAIRRKGWPIPLCQDGCRLLQDVRDTAGWEPWLVYMLEGVEQASRQTIRIIARIKEIMQDYKHRIRAELPRIYNRNLLNNLFRYPYIRIEFIQNDLGVSRLTATNYLQRLTEKDSVGKHKIGRYNYDANRPLMDVFTTIPDAPGR